MLGRSRSSNSKDRPLSLSLSLVTSLECFSCERLTNRKAGVPKAEAGGQHGLGRGVAGERPQRRAGCSRRHPPQRASAGSALLWVAQGP